MKEEAKRQLEQISIIQIKETIKKIIPEKYDKMLISDSQSFKRGDYVYAKMKYQKVVRQGEKILFPLFGSIRDNFSEIEGGLNKFSKKERLNSERIFEILQKSHSISGNPILQIDEESPFEFPLDEENNEISISQSKYFFPDLTFKGTCDECNGHKYVTCKDSQCNGQHKWTCSDCRGEGKIICENCAGRKKVDCDKCNGSNRIKCRRCGGDGRVNDGFIAKTVNTKYAEEKRCGDCAGKGWVQCRECTNGQVTCNDCSGNGKVSCQECHAQGTITCEFCYNDKERYGKINCPQCQTEGITAQIVYVTTNVATEIVEKFILSGQKINIGENQLKQHVQKSNDLKFIFKNINKKILDSNDEYSKIYAENIEKDLGLSKDRFPMLSKEEIFYQVIPCLELSYKHIITNTIHEFVIINFWDKPEFIFLSEPEQLTKDLDDAKKSVGGFFGKIFKTKSFKTKEDKKNEITLLILLGKINGEIQDQEKEQLSEIIGSLEDFTNSEKQKLFDIMNSAVPIEISKEMVKFSSKERESELIIKLEEMANADGEMELSEKMFIEKIKNLLG